MVLLNKIKYFAFILLLTCCNNSSNEVGTIVELPNINKITRPHKRCFVIDNINILDSSHREYITTFVLKQIEKDSARFNNDYIINFYKSGNVEKIRNYEKDLLEYYFEDLVASFNVYNGQLLIVYYNDEERILGTSKEYIIIDPQL